MLSRSHIARSLALVRSVIGAVIDYVRPASHAVDAAKEHPASAVGWKRWPSRPPTPTRLARIVLLCLLGAWALDSAIATLLASGFVGDFAPSPGLDARRPKALHDFGVLLESGRAALGGLNPYAAYPLSQGDAGPLTTAGVSNFNAPLSVAVFAPLAPFDPWSLRVAFFLVSIAAFATILFMLERAFPSRHSVERVYWALGLAGLWSTLLLGQVYGFLALATTLAHLQLLRRADMLAGLLMGLVIAVKPSFATWPCVLFASGHQRAAVWAVLSAATAALIPAGLFGPQIYLQWVAVVTQLEASPVVENGSLPGLMARLDLDRAGPASAVVLLLGTIGWGALRRPSARVAGEVGVAAALVASPVAWIGYSLFLLPMFFGRAWTLPLKLSAAIMLVPATVLRLCISVVPQLGMMIGSLYSFAFLAVLYAATMADSGAPMDKGPQQSCPSRDI